MLLHVASKQVEIQEKAAATASIVKWTAWLAEGPGNCLKKLHRFSRVATGWTESAKCKGEGDEIGERDDVDFRRKSWKPWKLISRALASL